MTDYSNRPGGALFAEDAKKKTNPNQPDFKGNIVLDPAVMDELVAQWKAGQPIKLELAGWTKPKRDGGNFLSLKASLPFRKTEQRSNQQPRVPSAESGSFGDDDFPF